MANTPEATPPAGLGQAVPWLDRTAGCMTVSGQKAFMVSVPRDAGKPAPGTGPRAPTACNPPSASQGEVGRDKEDESHHEGSSLGK